MFIWNRNVYVVDGAIRYMDVSSDGAVHVSSNNPIHVWPRAQDSHGECLLFFQLCGTIFFLE